MWSDLQKVYDRLQDEESRFIFMKRLALNLGHRNLESLYSLAIHRNDNGGHSLYSLIKNRDHYSEDQPIIMFGAGHLGKIYKNFSERYKVGDLIAYCDNKKELQGTLCEGLPVLSVEEACCQNTTALFVLASRKSGKEMKEQLERLGVEKERIFDFSHEKEIYRTQYFEPRIIRKHSGREVFIDGGSFDLRDTGHFINMYPNFEKVYAFEPDCSNYNMMLENKKNLFNDDKRIELINKGLWEKDERLNFAGGKTTASHLAEDGDITVNLTSIDEFFRHKEERVTFIKMDIEGAELKALSGAKEIIMRDKPDLAICIYHKKEDIIEIPKYILELNPQYELFIRHYSVLSPETVLYAVGSRTVPFELSDIKWKILTRILDNPDKIIEEVSKLNNLIIYGMGNLTVALVREMNLRNVSPLCIVDAYKESGNFEGIPVYNIKEVGGELEDKEVSVIVTPVTGIKRVYEALNEYGIYGKRIPVWDIIGDGDIAEQIKYINRL